MAEQATEQARDWLTLLLGGMGVSMTPYEYFGGLFLSLAAASVMSRQRKDPRKVWLMLLTAFLVATMVAIGWPYLETGFPPQPAMILGGFGSKWVVNIIAGFMDRVEERAPDLADSVIDRVDPDGKGDEK